MKVTPTPLKDCYLIEPKILGDDRGYFFESFNAKRFEDATGMDMNIVQENQSKSKKGVLRGLHFQVGDSAQAKIVRVLQGEVLDVVVDLRSSSPSFGKHHKEILTEDNKKQVYVPKGFAHGFLILSEEAEFFYCINSPYSPEDERGLLYDDPYLNIDWGIEQTEVVRSERDKKWPLYNPETHYFD